MHQLPELRYGYADLEPYMDEQTMRLHHTKHHQAYTDKLNAALEPFTELQTKPIEELLADLNNLPETAKGAIRNNGGGYFNHNLWWQTIGLAGNGPKEPTGALADSLISNFGSFADFKAALKDKALTHFGSGWAWLVTDDSKALSIMTTSNQDCPISQGLKPILGIDVWEHAYYLKYQNRRADYLEAVFSVLDWSNISERFKSNI